MTSKAYSLDSVKAVILVGSQDFGRCPLATRLNRALWPIVGHPVLQRLIEHISTQGIRRFVICHSQDDQNIQDSLYIPDHLDVEYRVETLPRGTAGCIRDAADPERDELLFVFPAASTAPPDLHDLISDHRKKMGIMTIFFTPPSEEYPAQGLRDTQIYLCEPAIMEYIPSLGYFDIKENLVPSLVQGGEIVSFSQLQVRVGNYRHWDEYIHAIKEYLITLNQADPLIQSFQAWGSEGNIWIGRNVTIDPSTRIIGPVLIGDNSIIGENVLLFGPVMIESDVQIQRDTLVSESVIWKGAVIGPCCRIQHSLIDEEKVLSSHTITNRQLIVHSSGWIRRGFGILSTLLGQLEVRFSSAQTLSESTLSDHLTQKGGKIGPWIALLAVVGCLLVVYWNPTLIELWRTWIQSDEYSSGLLVPFLAVYVLWDRKKELLKCPIKPVPLAFFILLSVQLLRLMGMLVESDTAERISLFLTIGVLIWMILGTQFAKKVFPIWLYLILMFPLPKMLELNVTAPLQKWATVSSVFLLETLGFSVSRDGNIININGTLVAVAEACNGLRMLTAFFVVTGFIVLLWQRKLWEKSIIFLSSVPIALLCNTIRLALTAIAFLYLKAEDWEKIFHDYGGLAMMPLAVGITLFELWFLSKLIIGPTKQPIKPQIIVREK